jgi:hypothetical protein
VRLRKRELRKSKILFVFGAHNHEAASVTIHDKDAGRRTSIKNGASLNHRNWSHLDAKPSFSVGDRRSPRGISRRSEQAARELTTGPNLRASDRAPLMIAQNAVDRTRRRPFDMKAATEHAEQED